MLASAPAELLSALAGVMKVHGWGWYVFGAQAVVAYGHPRMTADVDVTVALGGASTQRLVDAMATAEFRLRVADVDS